MCFSFSFYNFSLEHGDLQVSPEALEYLETQVSYLHIFCDTVFICTIIPCQNFLCEINVADRLCQMLKEICETYINLKRSNI